MRGVGQQQLINLEHGENAQRQPDPGKVTIAVVSEIVAVYWPDIQLEDFLPGPVVHESRPLGTLLRLAPKDSNAARRLKLYAPTR